MANACLPQLGTPTRAAGWVENSVVDTERGLGLGQGIAQRDSRLREHLFGTVVSWS